MLLWIESTDFINTLCAEYVIDEIKKFKPTLQKKKFVLGLSTGNSVYKLYEILVELYLQNKISLKNVVMVVFDELITTNENDKTNNRSFLYRNLFSLTDVDPANVIVLNGSAVDLEKEAVEFERKIDECGGIDLFLTSIGSDGHIGYNEPGSSLDSTTRTSNAKKSIADRFSENEKIPESALTVGISNILDCKKIFVIVYGEEKAEALHHVVECGVSHMWPASCLQMHPQVDIFCDNDSCARLTSRTVKYFKGLYANFHSFYDEDEESVSSIDISSSVRLGASNSLERSVILHRLTSTESTSFKIESKYNITPSFRDNQSPYN